MLAHRRRWGFPWLGIWRRCAFATVSRYFRVGGCRTSDGSEPLILQLAGIKLPELKGNTHGNQSNSRKAPAPPLSSNDPERLTDKDFDRRHTDELDEMVARLWGLQAAVAGAIEGSGDWNGVMQLIGDVTEKMEQREKAFEDVRLQRLAKGRANSQQAA